MENYDNLGELLEKRYGPNCSPHYLGRCLYKYTDCGPWTTFLVAGDEVEKECYGTHYVESETREIYYEDREAREGYEDWIDRCVAVRIGSIVEGSDVEVGPHDLYFPFTDEDLGKLIDSVDKESSFYWERDNSRWYILKHADCLVASVYIAWDDPIWEPVYEGIDIPDEITNKVNGLLLQGDLPDVDWRTPEVFTDLGNEWVLIEYINDSIY